MKPLSFFSVVLLATTLTLTNAHGQTLEVLHSFQNEAEGHPVAELIEGINGTFYGTTSGGSQGNGTIFRITEAGAFSTLVQFDSTNGSCPNGKLVFGNDNNLYGTTQLGGTNGYGTVFKMTTNGVLTTLVSFNFFNYDPIYPRAGLVLGSNGSFYGTSFLGGATPSQGTIFQITTDGVWNTLVSFIGPNGRNPEAGLVQGNDGNFYGTTVSGGDGNDAGTVFRFATNGQLSTLFSFTNAINQNGQNPSSELVQGSDGNFYGTTYYGGTDNRGTVFLMTADGKITTLVSFNITNGAYPFAGLVESATGDFYGTTRYGGANGYGTVFKITPEGTLISLASFSNTNGAYPVAGLVEGRDGNFYGTTLEGGTHGHGTVFRIVMPVTLYSRRSGNEHILTWRTNAVGFALQSAADLNSLTNWNDVTNLPVIVDGQFTVTNSIFEDARFYRLKK